MNTAVNSLQCIGVTINGFKTVPIPKPVEKLEDVHAERLYFVPYGSSTFKVRVSHSINLSRITFKIGKNKLFAVIWVIF